MSQQKNDSKNSQESQSRRQKPGGSKRPVSSKNGKSGGNNNQKSKQGIQAKNRPRTTEQARSASRGEAIRAQKRIMDDANRKASMFLGNQSSGDQQPERPRANKIDDTPRLKIIGLGGMDGGGSKNMMLVEYADDALVIDAGFDLGIDLPGINYGICDTTYMESIRHKIKGYVITHGHLDHIGGLPHIVPKFPAPIYGSKFTIGRVNEIFQNFGLPMPDGFELQTIPMNEHTHEKLKVGNFFVELVGVTHSITGSTVVVVDTPV